MLMKTIIVAIDFSTKTPHLLQEATNLARCFTAQVYLIHVAAPEPDFIGYDVGPDDERQFRAHKLHQEKKDLEHYAEGLKREGIKTTALLLQGETAKLLVKESEKLNADVLIMGSHGKGIARSAIMGSTCNDVIKHCQCPILIVPSNTK